MIIFKKYNFKIIALTLLLIGINLMGNAQVTVSGKVTDTNGNELIGTSIIEEGTTNGTITDIDGNYTVSVSPGATLVFRFLGFIEQTVAVENNTVIDIQLAEDKEVLEEVIVIGYGTQREESISGSVAKVKAEDLADIPQVSVDQLLQGRAAGVSVTQNSGQPGSSVSIRIRGVNSITGSSEPLYVIDGVPVSGDSRNIGSSGQATGSAGIGEIGASDASPLAGLNPNDIESIVVLKDASATAIYGSRGSNGVVLITTKQGTSSKAKLSYTSYYAIQRPTNSYELMNLQQYASFENDVRELYTLPPLLEFIRPDLLPQGTNWQQEIFQDAIMQNHNLSVSGGSDNHTYFFSGSFTDQEGIVLGSGFNRGTIRANLTSDINHKIKSGFSFTASRTQEDVSLTNSVNSVITLALLMPPSLAVRNPDGSFAGPVTQEQVEFGIRNPIAEATQISNTLIRNSILGNFFAEYEVLDGLKFRAEAGGNFGFNDTEQFQPSFQYGILDRGVNTAYKRRETSNFWILKQLLTYSKYWNRHGVTLLVGHEAQEASWSGFQGQDNGFVSNDFPILGSGDGNDQLPREYKGSQSLESYFARAIYSFGGKYDLTASIRRDVSSKFAPGRQEGYFPSVSASWTISEESFMSWAGSIQRLRFFGGYGEVGNQDIPGFAFGSRLNSASSGIGTGFEFANFANPDLTWESSVQVNAGINFAIFDSKLEATVEVYNKTSKDFLYQFSPNDAVTGGNAPGAVTPPWLNIGEMENRGIDIALNYNQEFNSGLVWNSALTVSHYRNRINELLGPTAINGSVSLAGDSERNVTFTREGQPIGLFYGYVVEGLFRTLEDIEGAPVQFGRPFENSLFSSTWLGDVKFADINNDGVVDGQDRTVIGNPHPDFTYGFQNTLTYKGFSLSIFLQGSYGNDIFNAVNRSLTSGNLGFRNQLPSVLDYWSVTNPNSSAPRLARGDTQNINVSERYIEDGSYLRIQNVTFGYTLPAAWVSRARLTRVRIYTSIQNLYTFTNYSGYDPEIGSINQDVLLTGIDNGRYPNPRTFTLGINIDF
ncbi:MAG: TonB-dependent receptor [Bacteroidota bacterium]